jgi:hypothetical protein
LGKFTVNLFDGSARFPCILDKQQQSYEPRGAPMFVKFRMEASYFSRPDREECPLQIFDSKFVAPDAIPSDDDKTIGEVDEQQVSELRFVT